MSNFKDDRNAFYSQINNYWDRLYGEEYSLYDVHKISENEAEKIRYASECIGKIFFKISSLLRTLDDEELIGMGFEPPVLNFLRINPIDIESVIGRLDLVKSPSGEYVVLEFNSDTPTFIKEVFNIGGLVCKDFKLKNPNEDEECELSRTIKNAIFLSSRHLNIDGLPNIVFTAHNDNVEDSNTAKYLMQLANLPAKFVPLDELTIIENIGLYDNTGAKIDILYRQTYPIEMALLDRDPVNDDKVGELLLSLVEQNLLAIINPPSAFLLQSKAVLAVIWGLHCESSDFFTPEEHSWIYKHFLPTYLEPDTFIKNGQKYVKKPVFGREGDTVEIYDGLNKIYEDSHKTYSDYLSVYQTFVPLPITDYQTEIGQRTGHLLVGSFLLNGKPSAFGYRVGNIITDNLSYYLPVGIE